MSARADDTGLDSAWLGRTAEPTTPQAVPHTPAAAPLSPSLEGLSRMSPGQLRDALIAEHGARQLAELQRNAAAQERDELRRRVAELEALAAGPRRVPSICRDCRGDGVADGADCDACGGEGCRS